MRVRLIQRKIAFFSQNFYRYKIIFNRNAFKKNYRSFADRFLTALRVVVVAVIGGVVVAVVVIVVDVAVVVDAAVSVAVIVFCCC